MCGFSFTFDFLFCMWCCTCTVTGKSSKDKENVRLTGFDVIRERHNSNSEAPFNNSVPGVPPEGVWQLSPLALWLDRRTKKVYSLKVSLQCHLSVKMCITKKNSGIRVFKMYWYSILSNFPYIKVYLIKCPCIKSPL